MIRAEYTPTYDDFRRLSLALWVRRGGWYLGVVGVMIPLATVVAFVLATRGAPPNAGSIPVVTFAPAAFVCLFVYVVVPVQTLRAIRRRWETAPQLQEPRAYEFTDDGIRVRGESYDARHSWSLVKSAGVVRGLLVIEDNQGAVHFLPRDAFEADRWDALGQLIARHVTNARLPE